MNLTLIGMSGVGKSYFGKEVARRLNFNFIDTDDLIRARLNCNLQEFIDKNGDEAFIKLEEEEVLKIKDINNTVIASGGSVVYSDKAINHLKSFSKIIFLKASLNSIKSWVSGFEQRGIVGLKNKSLSELYNERCDLYKRYAGKIIIIKRGYDYNKIVNKIISSNI